MLVKQISVYIQNKPGQAYRPIKALGDAGVDLCAIQIADSSDFGILRMITRDNAKAAKALRDVGCTVAETELIGAIVKNVPGGLAHLMSFFDTENINIEYFYSYLPKQNEEVIMFFKVEQPNDAIQKLIKHEVRLVDAKNF